MSTDKKLRPPVRDAILQSLRAGVVPRVGQQHIQVGRIDEVKALLSDIERISDGGSGIRFVIGEYGSGKTFFLHLVRSIALEKKLVTVHADLTPDRRLHASGGQARGLYQELMRNLSTRSKPEGGALSSVVERFVTTALSEAKAQGITPEAAIHSRLAELSEMVGGYAFADVIAAYWRGYDSGDDTLRTSAVRWLRAEFTTKTDAKKALGVRTIIDDASIYDHLKLFARFVRIAGYGGLLVCVDELVNLFKLPSGQARRSNYEQILRILNDSLQGSSCGMGMLLGGTPEFLMDPRRGLYSYEALQGRLAENSFAKEGLVDFDGPVLSLPNLSQEDLFVLLQKICRVHSNGGENGEAMNDEVIHAFMDYSMRTVGSAYYRTPRKTITAFVKLLSVLEQNPEASWRQVLERDPITEDHNPDIVGSGQADSPVDSGAGGDDDDLSSFKL